MDSIYYRNKVLQHKKKPKHGTAITRKGPMPEEWYKIPLISFSKLTSENFKTIRMSHLAKPTEEEGDYFRKCPNSNWKQCIKNHDWSLNNVNIGKITIGKQIGRGAFGKVFSGKALLDGKDTKVAIKVIEGNQKSKDVFSNFKNGELWFSIQMGRDNFAPKVYGAFYIEKNYSHIYVLIMEGFDGDLNKAINLSIKNRGPEKTKTLIRNLVTDSVQIIDKKIRKSGIICSDIKPGNFVYRNNLSDPEKPLIRMIDFGFDFCEYNSVPDVDRNLVTILITCLLSVNFNWVIRNEYGKRKKLAEEAVKISQSAFADSIDLPNVLSYTCKKSLDILKKPVHHTLVMNIAHYWKGKHKDIVHDYHFLVKNIYEFLIDGFGEKYYIILDAKCSDEEFLLKGRI